MGWDYVYRSAPRYRELNIMNSVLNKGFVLESFHHLRLTTFSDVFHRASRMQNCPEQSIKACIGYVFVRSHLKTFESRRPAKENLVRSGNAC